MNFDTDSKNTKTTIRLDEADPAAMMDQLVVETTGGLDTGECLAGVAGVALDTKSGVAIVSYLVNPEADDLWQTHSLFADIAALWCVQEIDEIPTDSHELTGLIARDRVRELATRDWVTGSKQIDCDVFVGFVMTVSVGEKQMIPRFGATCFAKDDGHLIWHLPDAAMLAISAARDQMKTRLAGAEDIELLSVPPTFRKAA